MTDTDTLNEELRAIVNRAMARAAAAENDPDAQRNLAELRARREAREAFERETARQEALRTACVPEDTWRHLAAPDRTPYIEGAQRFLVGKPEDQRFLLLLGPPGAGKTVAAGWTVAQRGGRYITAQELVIAGSFDRPFLRALEAAEVLVIDEMGHDKMSSAYEATLYDLLDCRFRRIRRTVLCANLGGPAFFERYCSGTLEPLRRRLRFGTQVLPSGIVDLSRRDGELL